MLNMNGDVNTNCIVCGKLLTGKQTKFCSKKCKNKNNNSNYKTNSSALCFHHLDPKEKEIKLDARTLAVLKNEQEVLKELKKCILLCCNCHAEIHHPDITKENLEKIDLKSIAKVDRSRNHRCKNCNRKIGNSTKELCVDCYRSDIKTNGRRPINTLPSKEELIILLKDNSKMQLARELKTTTRRITKIINS